MILKQILKQNSFLVSETEETDQYCQIAKHAMHKLTRACNQVKMFCVADMK